MLGKAKIDFDSIIYPFDKKTAIHVWRPELYDEYVRYINKHRLTQAKIVMPSLDILYDCPTLQYLHIHPRFDSPDEYDFNLKDKDLPKARKVVFGNESIDEWRRLK